MALLLLDLDNFKIVNDELGHDAGDQLLKVVAERLSHCLRQTDTVAHEPSEAARYGGDEFVILLEDITNIEDVENTAKRILEIVGAPVPLGDTTCITTVSIGIALYPDHAEDIAMLMRQADNAMYHAKAGGRNRLRFVKASA
jgi:diguanylate cyclase (GGDEF)-like protein